MNNFLRSGRVARWGVIGLVAVAFLVGCGDDDEDESATPSAAPNEVSLLAGINDEEDVTIAVTEFLPAAIRVAPGTTVEWKITGPEPHSVTFLPTGQEPPSPSEAGSLFAPTPPTGPFDGTTLVNSGLGPLGPEAVPPFRVEFSTPGEYGYVCVIHPLMTGTVTVAETGADTQQAITARADDELAMWLEDGRAAKARLEATPPVSTKNPDGSNTWKIAMGTTTEHTDILAFSPASAEVRPGDSVTFVNDSLAPHTATFAGGVEAPTDPESPEAQTAAPGPSPQTLAATGLFNTGLLPPNAPPGAGPPEAVRSYTYVIPKAGTYNYVCIFHVPSAMAGSIKVA